MWPISDSSVNCSRSWTDLQAQKEQEQECLAACCRIEFCKREGYRSQDYMAFILCWCAMEGSTFFFFYQMRDDEEKAIQNLNYVFLWSNCCYIFMEVFVVRELRPGVVGLWCEWLHWNRFNPKCQDFKGLVFSIFVSTSAELSRMTVYSDVKVARAWIWLVRLRWHCQKNQGFRTRYESRN